MDSAPKYPLCRKCGKPVVGARFGSDATGWEHVGCPGPEPETVIKQRSTLVYACEQDSCLYQDVQVQTWPRMVGNVFIELPRLRCQGCGCEPTLISITTPHP